MKKLFKWLEDLENKSNSANKNKKDYSKLIWKVSMRIFTLLTWIAAVGAVDGIRMQSGSLELLWLYIMMFGVLLMGIFASMFQILVPIMENIENRIKDTWSYPVGFIMRFALAIVSTALFVFYVALPIIEMVVELIEVIGSEGLNIS